MYSTFLEIFIKLFRQLAIKEMKRLSLKILDKHSVVNEIQDKASKKIVKVVENKVAIKKATDEVIRKANELKYKADQKASERIASIRESKNFKIGKVNEKAAKLSLAEIKLKQAMEVK
jgi:hypothetical protein